LLFPTDADEERMQTCRLGGVKHGYGTGARGDHSALGKADPLVPVLIEELVTDGPVIRLVFPPVGVNLLGDLGGQLVSNASHG
jgi:hypothetical protein